MDANCTPWVSIELRGYTVDASGTRVMPMEHFGYQLNIVDANRTLWILCNMDRWSYTHERRSGDILNLESQTPTNHLVGLGRLPSPWPLRVCLCCPVSGSHSLTVLSWELVASSLLSGEKATVVSG